MAEDVAPANTTQKEQKGEVHDLREEDDDDDFES